MKTKREVLKLFSQRGFCANLNCTECPYYKNGCKENLYERLDLRLAKVGAIAILRMYKEKGKPILDIGTKIKFSDGNIATISNVDCGNLHYYTLVFGNGHIESSDYLIGRNWEVIKC